MTSHLSFQDSYGVVTINVTIPISRVWYGSAVVLVTITLLISNSLFMLAAILLGTVALRRVRGYSLLMHQQFLLTVQTSTLLSSKEQLIGTDSILNVFVNEVPIQPHTDRISILSWESCVSAAEELNSPLYWASHAVVSMRQIIALITACSPR